MPTGTPPKHDLIYGFIWKFYKRPKRDPESFHQVGMHAMDYGVVCFGPNKKDCFIRIFDKPLIDTKLLGKYKLQINYLAAIDVLLFLAGLIYTFFGNPWPLILLLLLLVYFFIY